jgi:hypothetical protein
VPDPNGQRQDIVKNGLTSGPSRMSFATAKQAKSVNVGGQAHTIKLADLVLQFSQAELVWM